MSRRTLAGMSAEEATQHARNHLQRVTTHRGHAAPDQVSELVRHLDAARQVAAALATRDAA